MFNLNVSVDFSEPFKESQEEMIETYSNGTIEKGGGNVENENN